MKLILAIALLCLSACSSTPKQAAAPPPAPPSAPEKPAPAMQAPSSNTQTAVCTNGEDKRTLEVTTKGSGCELNYTKAGKASMVSSSSQGTTYCENSLKKIQGKLEKAGFDCK